MTTFINDKQLIEVSKALNNEASVAIDEVAFSEDDSPASSSVTSFGSEVGTRSSVLRVRNDNVLLLSTLRTANQVVDTADGDNLKRIMFVDGGSSHPLVLASFANVLHTANFDLSLELELEVTR